MLAEAALIHLSAKGRFSKEFHERLWQHMAETARTLAIMRDETPREIFEEAFGQGSPSDEEWRAISLPQFEAEAAEFEIEDLELEGE